MPNPYQLTTLPSDEELRFQLWRILNKVPFDPSPIADYDMRGYYDKYPERGRSATGINPTDKQLHYTDEFKTPYHESYSSESRGAPSDAPMWVGEGLFGMRGQGIYPILQSMLNPRR